VVEPPHVPNLKNGVFDAIGSSAGWGPPQGVFRTTDVLVHAQDRVQAGQSDDLWDRARRSGKVNPATTGLEPVVEGDQGAYPGAGNEVQLGTVHDQISNP
jgi:hypothetical protein